MSTTTPPVASRAPSSHRVKVSAREPSINRNTTILSSAASPAPAHHHPACRRSPPSVTAQRVAQQSWSRSRLWCGHRKLARPRAGGVGGHTGASRLAAGPREHICLVAAPRLVCRRPDGGAAAVTGFPRADGFLRTDAFPRADGFPRTDGFCERNRFRADRTDAPDSKGAYVAKPAPRDRLCAPKDLSHLVARLDVSRYRRWIATRRFAGSPLPAAPACGAPLGPGTPQSHAQAG